MLPGRGRGGAGIEAGRVARVGRTVGPCGASMPRGMPDCPAGASTAARGIVGVLTAGTRDRGGGACSIEPGTAAAGRAASNQGPRRRRASSGRMKGSAQAPRPGQAINQGPRRRALMPRPEPSFDPIDPTDPTRSYC